ncbi:uncharacterized protein LOC122665618 [Telopea speciosissima]|uniref:uncharacterized protein LOC122665618 n=1 Tax=Telopea speciosissima TaxID=54955 RepID=UPI001CC82401|nr:uncharacterized protein LOC122665618 [Telopea speciosissima]
METKSKERKILSLSRKLAIEHYLCVEPQGASGGLAMLWNSKFQVQNLSANNRIMDFHASSNHMNPFFLTSVYGDPIPALRQAVWNKLESIGANRNERWICFGDFNSYVSWHKKSGGRTTITKDVTQFREMLNSCHLMDLGAHGPRYTWRNNRAGPTGIQIRLDRVLSNSAWRLEHEDAVVFVKPEIGSDHNPIIIDTEGNATHGPRSFHFEAMCLRHSGCSGVAAKAWSITPTGTVDHRLKEKIVNCKPTFQKWNKETFGNVHQKINSLMKDLEILQDGEAGSTNQVREKEIISASEEELSRQEIMFQQKSRIEWTMDKNGAGISTEPMVDSTLNAALCEIPSPDEIKKAIFSMGPLKAPGPDGLPPIFYQKFWEVTYSEVVDFVIEFLTHNRRPEAMNDTFICLIPKCPNPETVDQFRPITSGQAVNCEKSILTFSPNTPPKIKRWFSKILKIKHGAGPQKYLGLPTLLGLSKVQAFREIGAKTAKCLQGWKHQLLSQAGKEVLIKSVALLMNNFVAAHFKLSKAHHGNGEQIHKWADNWIPGNPSFKIQYPRLEDYEFDRVSQLIDVSNMRWKFEIMQDIFHPFDLAAIKQIHLPLFPREDRQVWTGPRNGKFTVKSAYEVICMAQRSDDQAQP